MSGLQASISTHIAQRYQYPTDGSWGPNLPLFWRAVGAHPQRVQDMHFTLLFLLRATQRAAPALLAHPLHTGDTADDLEAQQLLRELVNPHHNNHISSSSSSRKRNSGSSSIGANADLSDDADLDTDEVSINGDRKESTMDTAMDAAELVDQCRSAFDESALFQVNAAVIEFTSAKYYESFSRVNITACAQFWVSAPLVLMTHSNSYRAMICPS